MMSFDALIPNITMTISFLNFFDRPGGPKLCKLRTFCKFIFKNLDFGFWIWYFHYLQLKIYKIHWQNVDH